MEPMDLILVGLAVLSVPLLGTVMAMLLGVLVTLARQHPGAFTGDACLRLESRLRAWAATLGCYVEDDVPALAREPRRCTDSRVTRDRRLRDRRLRTRRQLPRMDADRRRRDRRVRERRLVGARRVGG